MRQSILVYFLLLALAVGSLVGLLGCSDSQNGKIPITTSSDKARELYLTGRTYLENIRAFEAREYFESAIEHDPNFALAHLQLALTKDSRDALIGGLQEAEKLSAGASEGEQLMIEAALAAAEGRRAEQIDKIKELIELYPMDERVQTQLGTAYFIEGKFDSAVTWYAKAIEINPDFPPAHNQLGYCYRYLGDFAQAEKQFERYIELIPTDPNPYDSYAELLLERGEFEESIKAYRKALSFSSRFTNSYIGIAANYNYQGKYREARDVLQELYRSAATYQQHRTVHMARAVSFIDEGEYDDALAEIVQRRVLARKANDTSAIINDYVFLAYIDIYRQEFKPALASLDTALAIAEGTTQSPLPVKRALIGSLYLSHAVVTSMAGDFDEADQWLAKFNEMAEEHPDELEGNGRYLVRGIVSYEKGKFAEALEHLSYYDQRDPGLLYYRAKAEQGLGNVQAVRENLQRLIALRPVMSMGYSHFRHDAARLLTII